MAVVLLLLTIWKEQKQQTFVEIYLGDYIWGKVTAAAAPFLYDQ